MTRIIAVFAAQETEKVGSAYAEPPPANPTMRPNAPPAFEAVVLFRTATFPSILTSK
jgi:hypothetical protein